jgi:putative glutamine amidotransferase
MKVSLTVHDMVSYYRRWFPEIDVIGDSLKVKAGIDLLFVPGGRDVDPTLYHDTNKTSYGVNLKGDKEEMDIIRIARLLNPDIKIVGICRGMQLLNVLYGGSLIQDLDSTGRRHEGIHAIEYTQETPFAWLTKVNSLHHQAIDTVGYINGDVNTMGYEPRSGIVEMIAWGKNSLGFQFHPEMFSEAVGDRFFSIIKDWASGHIPPFARDREKPKALSPDAFKINFADIEAHTWNILNTTGTFTHTNETEEGE